MAKQGGDHDGYRVGDQCHGHELFLHRGLQLRLLHHLRCGGRGHKGIGRHINEKRHDRPGNAERPDARKHEMHDPENFHRLRLAEMVLLHVR